MADPAASLFPTETWWIAALSVALLVGAMVWLVRRQRRDALRNVAVVDWGERARTAEGRAAQAETVVKAGLIPHLARLLRARLVVGLMRQRSELADTQREGAERIEDLEQRLASAHANLQEKLASYERRIEQLQSPTSPAVSQPSTTSDPSPSAPPPPSRRNPLVNRTPRPEPEPLSFGQILARRKDASPTSEPPEGST